MASVALPVLPGKAERVRNFAQELEPHRAEWDRLCREAGGFTHYNMTLQESPMGDLCIYSMVLDDPAKIRMRFGDTPYDRWWLAFAKDVHGIDLNGPDVPAPPPSVFTWKAPTA
jgi:hypothetical protein